MESTSVLKSDVTRLQERIHCSFSTIKARLCILFLQRFCDRSTHFIIQVHFKVTISGQIRIKYMLRGSQFLTQGGIGERFILFQLDKEKLNKMLHKNYLVLRSNPRFNFFSLPNFRCYIPVINGTKSNRVET